MPWYDVLPAVLTGRRPEPQADPVPQALTAAAVPAAAPVAQNIRVPDRWQNEAWTYYDTLGEFRYGVNWLANMMSRVRLRAGTLDPSEDEPVIQDQGLAAQIMAELGNGIGGRSEILRRLTVQLSVPGEGYLIGETVKGVSMWQVRSVDEVRAQGNKYQVTDETTVNTGAKWRDLAPDSIPIRVWRPHDRWYHLADSPARAALPVMKELELVNRHIAAGYLSRLASSGVIVLPNEVTFASREEDGDAGDDFVTEWIEIAATGIQNPGTASAMIPIPIKVPADMVDKIRFIDFTVKVDDKILEKRDQVIRRLATILDIPSDVMLGLGDTNHWTAWAVDESGLKVHVAPTAEQICAAITTGYLQPRLIASHDDTARSSVTWYDMSALTLRPDTSQNAKDAYDRMEISGGAYRNAMGFSDDDAPTTAELEQMGLKALIRDSHGAAPGALDALLGKQVVVPATQGPGAAGAPQGPIAPPGEAELPSEKGAPPPPSDAPPSGSAPKAPPVQRASVRRSLQAAAPHAVRFLLDGQWNLVHPQVCEGHAYSCPFTHAVMRDAPAAVPGTPGTYRARMDAFGRMRIDGEALYLDTSGMVHTLLLPSTARKAART